MLFQSAFLTTICSMATQKITTTIFLIRIIQGLLSVYFLGALRQIVVILNP